MGMLVYGKYTPILVINKHHQLGLMCVSELLTLAFEKE